MVTRGREPTKTKMPVGWADRRFGGVSDEEASQAPVVDNGRLRLARQVSHLSIAGGGRPVKRSSSSPKLSVQR